LLISFALAGVIAVTGIPILRRLKAGQSILKYVDMHKGKSGTPTIGGIIFILPVILLSCFFIKFTAPLCLIIVLGSVGYALIGFLDDYIKVKMGHNLGLRAYQKIIGQGGLALLISYFYMRANPSGVIFLPFFNILINIGGIGIFVLTLLILIATTNAVNLTDGVDGLAGSVSLIYFVFVYVLIFVLNEKYIDIPEIVTIGKIIAVLVGALMAFLLFNTKKASVFMGDTGSLFLGAAIAMITTFTYLGFAILILGIVFVWSAVTVIIQVSYFKLTKGKRVFLMTPFHHHLEKRGFAEPKIVAVYTTVTIIAGIILFITIVNTAH
jgi:phospho-N-acetylmuramoyl-pentapeptide-transferase